MRICEALFFLLTRAWSSPNVGGLPDRFCLQTPPLPKLLWPVRLSRYRLLEVIFAGSGNGRLRPSSFGRRISGARASFRKGILPPKVFAKTKITAPGERLPNPVAVPRTGNPQLQPAGHPASDKP
jgi:hypothetical protein